MFGSYWQFICCILAVGRNELKGGVIWKWKSGLREEVQIPG